MVPLAFIFKRLNDSDYFQGIVFKRNGARGYAIKVTMKRGLSSRPSIHPPHFFLLTKVEETPVIGEGGDRN